MLISVYALPRQEKRYWQGYRSFYILNTLKHGETADSIFIIKSLIHKYLHKNKNKFYVCFVDFFF